MMPNLKKSMILLIICICFAMSASCAFAADLNQTADGAVADGYEVNLDIEEIEIDSSANDAIRLSQQNDVNEVLTSENVTESSTVVIPASYDDLAHDIENLRPGEVYNIEKDYVIENCGDDISKDRIININADNVVIDGNGHTIDANKNRGYFAIFNVTGNNVTIVNLNIINSRARNYEYSISNWNRYDDEYTRVVSPVEWHGNNGVISNCVFDDNTGEEGGAIYWVGNNGVIDNCHFNDNAATRGGSIYISGCNNTISNCVIENSYSEYFDAIFFKNFDEDGKTMVLTLNNCTFPNTREFIEEYYVEGQCVIISDNSQIYPEIPMASYSELSDIIRNLKDGDVYNLTEDYYFDYGCLCYPIKANNVTINGNGHTIYGYGVLAYSLISVLGDNVSVNSVIFDFKNVYDNKWASSIVDWKGNGGSITDCAFIGNKAEYGGAITWKGNNGIIEDCLFVNDTARIAAGAIFITGINNTIRNALIINCSSAMTGEAIFIDSKRRNLTMENVYSDNETLIFIDEGAIKSNIDVTQFTGNGCYVCLGGAEYEISELIYLSIMKGGVIKLNDQISGYCNYYNESGDFVFTITKRYAQHNIDYSESLYFKNIFNNSFNDVFTQLKSKNYETRFAIIKTEYVGSEEDYKYAMGQFYNSIAPIAPIMDDLEIDLMKVNNLASTNPLTLAFDVQFTKALVINNVLIWNLTRSSFNVLNINGAGSTIQGSFDEDKEEKWVTLSPNMVFTASNINLEGFNTVIENIGGQCIFNHVNFNNNRMDYLIYRDWGAAILNTGMVTCINCSFTNNYAKNGGAIFNQGVLTLMDCTFEGNEGYGEGDNVCVGDGGQVRVDNVTISANGQSPFVHFAESMSLTETTLITVACVAASFIVGTVVGFFTANIAAGIAAGALVGAAIGTGVSAWVISEHFDINFDRLKIALFLIIGSAVSGGLGGYAGGYWGAQFAADAAWIASNGGPTEATVLYFYTWYDVVGAELLAGGLLGGLTGVIYYFTE